MPSFTAGDMQLFRDTRAKSIWKRGGDISGNEDALVVLRHHIVNQCRDALQKEIKRSSDARAEAEKKGCHLEAQIHSAVLAKLAEVRASLENLIDMDSYRRVTK
jgi:hypothetical protein